MGLGSVTLISKLNQNVGYFDPTIYIFRIIEINNFWDDLPDISAEKASLVGLAAESTRKALLETVLSWLSSTCELSLFKGSNQLDKISS